MPELKKKSRFAETEIFLGFERDLDLDLDFQKSGCRLKGRKSYHEFTLVLFVEIEPLFAQIGCFNPKRCGLFGQLRRQGWSKSAR